MEKKIRSIMIFVVISLMASCFVACGDDDEGGSGSGNDGINTSPITLLSGGKKKIALIPQHYYKYNFLST